MTAKLAVQRMFNRVEAKQTVATGGMVYDEFLVDSGLHPIFAGAF
jgi:hypothetical protein